MIARESFILTPAEVNTPVWNKLERHLRRRLEAARERNDGELTPEQTALVRGEIKALKGLLALGRPLPPIPAGDDGL